MPDNDGKIINRDPYPTYKNPEVVYEPNQGNPITIPLTQQEVEILEEKERRERGQ